MVMTVELVMYSAKKLRHRGMVNGVILRPTRNFSPQSNFLWRTTVSRSSAEVLTFVYSISLWWRGLDEPLLVTSSLFISAKKTRKNTGRGMVIRIAIFGDTQLHVVSPENDDEMFQKSLCAQTFS